VLKSQRDLDSDKKGKYLGNKNRSERSSINTLKPTLKAILKIQGVQKETQPIGECINVKYLNEPRIVLKPIKFDSFVFQSIKKLHQYQTQDHV